MKQSLLSDFRRRSLSQAVLMAAALLAGLTAPLLGIGAASAAPSHWETVHSEHHFVIRNGCGVRGLTTQIDIVFDARFRFTARGAQQLPHLQESRHVTYVFTNVASGESVTVAEAERGNDIRVTNNGNGTLTYLVLHTTNSVMRNEDGKAIARDTGSTRFRILVDHSGTPTDPSDDRFLEFLGDVKEPTGRNDDFCGAVVRAIG